MTYTDVITPVKQLNIYHVFQPIINLSNEEVVGFEALIRSEEIPNPEVLFQKASEEGTLYDLDMLSIQLACETFQKECLELSIHNSVLFINIFPSTLNHPQFFDEFIEIFESAGMGFDQVVVEINEKEKINLFQLNDRIQQLRQVGFRIALDDLGKGNSLINSLEIETHIAKIDRYYALNLTDSTKKRIFIQTIMESFPNDIFVVLEGIETEEDLIVAKELGVHYAQGYYIGRPGPLSDFVAED